MWSYRTTEMEDSPTELSNMDKDQGSCSRERNPGSTKRKPGLTSARKKVKVVPSCPTLRPHGLYSPWNSPGQNTEMGSCSLLQGMFPTQGSNPGLPHCKRILYQLSHKGSPKILEWVAYPFSRGSSQYRDQTRVSCTACGLNRQKS